MNLFAHWRAREAARRRPIRFLRGLLPCAALVAHVAGASPAYASSADLTPVVRAEPLAETDTVVLDGRLDEPFWQRTHPATDFLQQDPSEGAPPTERTEVHLAFDRDALYLGVVLHDSEPGGVIGHQRRRDAGLGSDDRFMWVIDTFLNGRSGYFFEINPAGLMGDGLLRVSSSSNVNKSWDGIWDARVTRGDGGWTAEVRLPFRTFNFDPRLDAWGINFQRTIRRKNEEVLWSGYRRTEGLMRPVHAGRLEGLSGITQGLGLEVRPYTAGSYRDDSDEITGGGGDFDIGVDVGYSITPSLRAALTVNTDFAEADVDDRRVNLTRFPLQLPELRQFFLEGSGVYSFAPSSNVNPYFSRRIGLVDGEPIPITYGARLGGQAGPYDIGLLQVRTAEHQVTPVETFTVGRIRRNIFEQSSVGVIYTRRATDDSPEGVSIPVRQTIGADLELTSSRFLGSRNAQLEAFYVWHTDPAGTGTPASERTARGVRVSFPNDVWSGHVSLREFGREWDPAVGFAPRVGFRRLQPSIQWAPRPSWDAVRQVRMATNFEYLTDLAGRLETQRLTTTPLGVEFESGDGAGVEVDAVFERLTEPFEISAGVVLPPGDYRFGDVEARLHTASRRRMWGHLEVSTGDFWSGRRQRLATGVGVRPTMGVDLFTDVERQDVSLPQGDFATTLVRMRANWYASPWSSVTTTVQYDDVSDVLGLYWRLRWILRPGSNVYLVYAHNWQEDVGRWRTVSRGGTTKINYTHRF